MSVDESSFETLAERTLGALMDAIDEALGDYLDVDLQGGILTIELDGGGRYVINKHAANREIWLSSPASGASHYAFDPASVQWVGTRDGAVLTERLAVELSAATGESFHIG